MDLRIVALVVAVILAAVMTNRCQKEKTVEAPPAQTELVTPPPQAPTTLPVEESLKKAEEKAKAK